MVETLLDGRMDGWIKGWMVKRVMMDGHKVEKMNEWLKKHGYKVERTDELMDGW